MSALLPATSAAATLAGTLTVASEQTDFSGLGDGASSSRLGGFVSDLYYQRHADLHYGVTDRGPGGGLVSYVPRIQQFTLGVDAGSGGLADFHLQKTILLKNSDGTARFDGLAPDLLHLALLAVSGRRLRGPRRSR